MKMIQIIFDPGHGLPDPGAVSNGLYEYQLSFEVAALTRTALGRMAEIIFTRDGPDGFSADETEDLAARCRIANKARPDLVLSFHFNAGGGHGPEVYTLPKARSDTVQKAALLHDALAAVYGYGRGIKQENFYILRYTDAPAILLELGFLDSPRDAAQLKDPVFRQRLALALAGALIKSYNLEDEDMSFKDVAPERWSAASIKRVTDMGIMGGYEDGTFRPGGNLTREELASVMDRYTFRDGIFTDVLPWVMDSVVQVENTYKGVGSGACIAKTAKGSYILTNYHVIKDNQGISIFDGEKGTPAEHIISDIVTDLSLLRTAKDCSVMEIADQPLALGEPVAVIGSPMILYGSVTVGIVSNLHRQDGAWLQTDAPINPGNSGGPIINERGHLAAVAVAKMVAPDVDNIAYGVKLELVKKFLHQVKDKIV